MNADTEQELNRATPETRRQTIAGALAAFMYSRGFDMEDVLTAAGDVLEHECDAYKTQAKEPHPVVITLLENTREACYRAAFDYYASTK